MLFNGKSLEIGKAVLSKQPGQLFSVLPVEPITLQGKTRKATPAFPTTIAEEKAVKAIQKHSMNIGGKQRKTNPRRLFLGKPAILTVVLPTLEAFNFVLEGYFGNEESIARLWPRIFAFGIMPWLWITSSLSAAYDFKHHLCSGKCDRGASLLNKNQIRSGLLHERPWQKR